MARFSVAVKHPNEGCAQGRVTPIMEVTAKQETQMQDNDFLTPAELREVITEVGIDITAARWPNPGFVIALGDTVAPHRDPGTLIVNGQPVYSGAWL